MSPLDERKPTDSDHQFDLLVDGELSEAQRRELLLGLDDEPGGWRRCALAFLEAQAWKQQLGEIAREPAPQPPTKRPARRFRITHHLGTLAAMAASFTVALLVGSQVRDWWTLQPIADSPSSQIAGVADVTGPVVPPNSPASTSPTTPQLPDGDSPAWRLVGNSQSIQLPATERDSLDEKWLQNLPSAMPEDVVRDLKRHGYRVEQRRGLLPFRMKDGRPLVVPVDEVDIRYVDNPAL